MPKLEREICPCKDAAAVIPVPATCAGTVTSYAGAKSAIFLNSEKPPQEPLSG